MPRKSGLESTLDDLSIFPWWLLLLLSPLAYIAIRFGLPMIDLRNPMLAGIMPALSIFAWIPALVLVMASIGSFIRSRKRRRLLERQKGIETIRALSWQEFEQLVGEAYRRQGYAVTETGKDGPDGGVDVRLRKDGETVLVQCKHWRSQSIGVPIVRELLGAVTAASASRGIVVGSGTFTKSASEFARANRIELVDGETLTQFVTTVQDGPVVPQPDNAPPIPTSMSPTDSKANNPACPLCGELMIKRVAKRGANAGNRFLGCSHYPSCRGTRHVEDIPPVA